MNSVITLSADQAFFCSDPNNERIKTNLATFERMRHKKAEEKLADRYDKKEKSINKKKKNKFIKFYYTPDEDHYQRYLLEKTVAKRLCRGETKPIVSYIILSYFSVVIYLLFGQILETKKCRH